MTAPSPLLLIHENSFCFITYRIGPLYFSAAPADAILLAADAS